MGKVHPFVKRVKRHVTARKHDFFIAAAPDCEKICFKEIKLLPLSENNPVPVSGGIEFSGSLPDCYLINLCARTANRILMRLCDFKSTNFRQLEKKLSDFPWELYLPDNNRPKIHITSRHSRLYHKKAIADHFTQSIAKRFSRSDCPMPNPAGNDIFPQNIFVRTVDDRFTVSIDSSGELLYKRGIKTTGSRAPIRETTAAAILQTAGYNSKAPIIDPMCGSGTFSIEAAMMARNIPAGWYRDFAFMGWPCFRPGTWKHIKRELEKQFITPGSPVIFASDLDPAACKTLKKNTAKHDLEKVINVQNRDFFNLKPSDIAGRPGLIVINPPYGIRLGSKKYSRKTFSTICKKLRKDFTGWRAAVIAPHKNQLKDIPLSLTPHKLVHGGLNVTLLTGIIK